MKESIAMTLILLLFVMSSSCATLSNRTKNILMSVGLGVAAGTVGGLLAPQDENAIAHGFMWGGVTLGASSIAGMWIFDEEKKSDDLSRQLDSAKKEVKVYRGEDQAGGHEVIEKERTFQKELPEEYKNLVKPGGWALYRINNWVSTSENTLVHQDKILRIDPPSFSGAVGSQSGVVSSTKSKEGEKSNEQQNAK